MRYLSISSRALSPHDAAVFLHDAEMFEAVEAGVDEAGLVLEGHHAADVIPIEGSP